MTKSPHNNPNRQSGDSMTHFLDRVKGNIRHVDDPKVQRMVREIDARKRQSLDSDGDNR